MGREIGGWTTGKVERPITKGPLNQERYELPILKNKNKDKTLYRGFQEFEVLYNVPI